MGKQPYIPIYIGDWQKDTNTISLEAEGALLKLCFKLWDAKKRGELSISFNQLSILLKKGRDLTEKILQELKENDVLNIEFLENETIFIQSRRMLKDVEKSKAASENGKKGGRGKKANQKLNESKSKAKVKLNTDNDIDNDNVIENEILKGGVGEKCLPDLVEVFFNDLENSTEFETISRDLKLPRDRLKTYIEPFRAKKELSYPNFQKFATHFKNWVNTQINGQQGTKNNASITTPKGTAGKGFGAF